MGPSHLKLAWRVLLRRPFFTAVSLFAVAFTLTVLLVATALLDHAFAPGPPERRGDRTLGVYGLRFSGPQATSTGTVGYGFLDRHVRGLPDVEEVTILSQRRPVAAYRDGRRLDLWLKQADGAYWRVLDFDFLEGGPFSEEDDEAGSAVAVISREARERLFDGRPAVGRELVVDGQALRVVGVVENVSFVRMAGFADIWVPHGSAKSQAFRQEDRGSFMALILARHRDDFPRIQAAFRQVLANAELRDERFESVSGGADTLLGSLSRNMFSEDYSSSRVWLLQAAFVAAGLLFAALPAVNLVNLNVSRILERSSEIGVRKAFGASSASLVGQFLLENVVLTMIGAGLSLVFASLILAVVEARGLIPHAELGLNWRVFGIGLLVALAFGLLSGVWPAWKMSRLHPVTALRGAAS